MASSSSSSSSSSSVFNILVRLWHFLLLLQLSLAQPYNGYQTPYVAILPRNLTLINSGGSLIDLYEWDATARCFPDLGVNSSYFQLCFTNTTPAAFTFSILTFDNTYDSWSHLFVHAAQSRVVWSANRDRLVGEAAVLHLQPDGDLTLRDFDGSLAWSSGTVNAGVAGISLDDWGNLSLFNSSNGTLWQSYDHPTDVLLQRQYLNPGMSLVGRVSDTDPSPGSFSLAMAIGGLAAYYNPSINGTSPAMPYWIFGCYGLNDALSVQHTCNDQFSLYVDGSNTPALDFIAYSSANPIPQSSKSPQLCNLNASSCKQFLKFFAPSLTSSLISFIRIESNGSVQAYMYYYNGWQVNSTILFGTYPCLPNSCGSYGICSISGSCSCPAGADSTSNSFQPSPSSSSTAKFTGCSPVQNLSCTAASNVSKSMDQLHQHFLNLTGIDYFPNLYSAPQNYTRLEDCVSSCLYNCSCTAVFYHSKTGSCFPNTEKLASLQRVSDESFLAFLRVQDIESSSHTEPKNVGLIAGVVVGAVACIIFIMLIGVWVYRKRQLPDWNTEDEEDEERSFFDALPTLPQRYSFRDLQSITQGFSKTLGGGGFGKVYAGTLSDGRQVAVKKLESLKQGKKEFRAEIAIMGGIQHVNLARLCGFCAERSHRLLVYEYVPNGSLDRWLFQDADNQDGPQLLNWSSRFQIALGTARGLAYLHEECAERIIHLDVKPQNILLDANFTPKVSDFGLSRLLTRDERSAVTTMRGTPGYLAPEWLVEGAITEKADVYSFGMVLLEIVSGRKNLDYTATSEKLFYPAWALKKVEEGSLLDLPDVRLGKSVNEQQANRMILVALLCIQEDPSARPSMDKVVQMLNGTIDVVDLAQPYKVSTGVEFAFRTQARLAMENSDLLSGSPGVMSSLAMEVESR